MGKVRVIMAFRFFGFSLGFPCLLVSLSRSVQIEYYFFSFMLAISIPDITIFSLSYRSRLPS